MKTGIRTRLMLAAISLAAAMPSSASACAACFGRSDSPMAHGMNMGILTLLAVIMSVLAGIAVFFIYLARRSARFGSAPAAPDSAAPAGLASPASQPTH